MASTSLTLARRHPFDRTWSAALVAFLIACCVPLASATAEVRAVHHNVKRTDLDNTGARKWAGCTGASQWSGQPAGLTKLRRPPQATAAVSGAAGHTLRPGWHSRAVACNRRLNRRSKRNDSPYHSNDNRSGLPGLWQSTCPAGNRFADGHGGCTTRHAASISHHYRRAHEQRTTWR